MEDAGNSLGNIHDRDAATKIPDNSEDSTSVFVLWNKTVHVSTVDKATCLCQSKFTVNWVKLIYMIRHIEIAYSYLMDPLNWTMVTTEANGQWWEESIGNNKYAALKII